MEERASLFPSGESTGRMEEQSLHTRFCAHSLTEPILPNIPLEASAILEAGGLGKRPGVKA